MPIKEAINEYRRATEVADQALAEYFAFDDVHKETFRPVEQRRDEALHRKTLAHNDVARLVIDEIAHQCPALIAELEEVGLQLHIVRSAQ